MFKESSALSKSVVGAIDEFKVVIQRKCDVFVKGGDNVNMVIQKSSWKTEEIDDHLNEEEPRESVEPESLEPLELDKVDEAKTGKFQQVTKFSQELTTNCKDYLKPIDQKEITSAEILPLYSPEELIKLIEEDLGIYGEVKKSNDVEDCDFDNGNNLTQTKGSHSQMLKEIGQSYDLSVFTKQEIGLFDIKTKVASNFHEVKSELAKYSTKEAFYECKKCPYKCKVKKSLKTHVMTKHEGVKFPCDKCPFVANNKETRYRHNLTEHRDLTFECVVCDKKFADLNTLRKHKKYTHEGLNFKCENCEYQGSTKQNDSITIERSDDVQGAVQALDKLMEDMIKSLEHIQEASGTEKCEKGIKSGEIGVDECDENLISETLSEDYEEVENCEHFKQSGHYIEMLEGNAFETPEEGLRISFDGCEGKPKEEIICKIPVMNGQMMFHLRKK